jgi:abequosyltransferase
MLDDQSTWLCVPKKLVGNRTHNESYAGKDSFARTRLDIEGFDLAFGDTLGRKNWAYRQAMSLVASFFIRVHFLVAKMRGSGWNYWRQAIPMTLAMYWRYPSFWLKAFPIALIPRSALLVREHMRTRRAAGRGRSTR